MAAKTKSRVARRMKDGLQLRIEIVDGSKVLDSLDVDLEDEREAEHLMEEFSEVLTDAGFEIDGDDDE